MRFYKVAILVTILCEVTFWASQLKQRLLLYHYLCKLLQIVASQTKLMHNMNDNKYNNSERILCQGLKQVS